MKTFQRVTVLEFFWQDFFAEKLDQQSKRENIKFAVCEHYNGVIDCCEHDYFTGERTLPPDYYNLTVPDDHKHIILYMDERRFCETSLQKSMIYYQHWYVEALFTYHPEVISRMGRCFCIIRDMQKIQSHWGSELNILYSNLEMNEVELDRISKIASGNTNGTNKLFQI